MDNLQNTPSNAGTVQTWAKDPQNLDSNHAYSCLIWSIAKGYVDKNRVINVH